MLFHGPASASDWVSRDGLTEMGSEELVVTSSRIWAEVGGWLKAASACRRSDDELGGALDVGRAAASEVVCVEELDVVLEERLEGVSEGESESV